MLTAGDHQLYTALSRMMTCQHPGCEYKSSKRASIARHFKGTNAMKTHTAEELERTLASAVEDVVHDGGSSEPAATAVPRETTADPVPPAAVLAPAAQSDTVAALSDTAPSQATLAPAAQSDPVMAQDDTASDHAPAAGAIAITTVAVKEALFRLVLEDDGFRNAIVRDIAAELLKHDTLLTDLSRLVAEESASTPIGLFGRESSVLMRSDDNDMRMWRTALTSATGVALAELVTRKHRVIFKNVRHATEGTISVYRGNKTWTTLPLEEAAERMLARCEHDVLDLYESQDAPYVRYKTQIETFARTVGGKLGWDITPYGCQHAEEEDEAFTASVTALIRDSITASFR